MSRTVRDAALDVLRSKGMTTIFANPGTTEMALLGGLPDDFTFILGLHESAVVGMAIGHATVTGKPAIALLHTAAGLGNAVNLVATARENRAPVVIVVGQQDRRHLAFQPFLAGRLNGLAGDYPVWSYEPPTSSDVPGAIERAYYEAQRQRGPAVVVVPMADWDEPLDPRSPVAAPKELPLKDPPADPISVAEVVRGLRSAVRPTLVVGAGADDPKTWQSLVWLAEVLSCDVYQEALSARAGFPQDHVRFRGHLPAERGPLRGVLGHYDVVLLVGVSGVRQFQYDPGPFFSPETRSMLVTDDPDVAASAPVDVAYLGSVRMMAAAMAEAIDDRESHEDGDDRRSSDLLRSHRCDGDAHEGPNGILTAAQVYARLGQLLPSDSVVLEETPSSRGDLLDHVPAREPLGHLAAAMGGLGFALPAAIGVRLAVPRRPVVAVLGDGSSLYSIQALWSAVHYRVGVLFLVMANHRYAVLDRQIEQRGHQAPWPAFDEVSVAAVADGFGCETCRCADLSALEDVFDEILPSLRERTSPLLVEIEVCP